MSTESHLKAAKIILRYPKETPNLVLLYPICYNFELVDYAVYLYSTCDNFNLVSYVDVDYVGYLVDRKSTCGMTHFLGSSWISWGTKK